MASTSVDNLCLWSERAVSGTAPRRYGPFLVLVLCLLAAVPASAQEVTATFHPQKPVYLLGEPIWFVFQVTNKGDVPVHIEYSNPYGVCAFGGGYWFDVAGAMPTGPWRCGYGASCAGGGSKSLAPGATYAQRLLLNQWFCIDHSGEYRVDASRDLHFGTRTDKFGMLVTPEIRSFRTQFEISVIRGKEDDVEKTFAPYLKNLASPDFDLRIEAVETITALAPPFLEKTIMALANGADSSARSRAIPALGRLNTTESRRVLARLIEDHQPDYSWQAIDALARTGDRTYLPLLEELARDPAWQNVAIPAVGTLGGEEAVSFLAPLVHYPLGPPNEPPVQSLAIGGLANTRSGKAVPYLIEALRNFLVQREAVNGLEQLTHFAIHEGKSGHWLYTEDEKTTDRMAKRWRRWWKANGKNAKLYGPDDCTISPAELPE